LHCTVYIFYMSIRREVNGRHAHYTEILTWHLLNEGTGGTAQDRAGRRGDGVLQLAPAAWQARALGGITLCAAPAKRTSAARRFCSAAAASLRALRGA
jgi:hypothetical protein